MMLRHMRMCYPNGLLFHQKSLDKDSILVKKILRRGPISPKLQKNWKIWHLRGKKTLRNRSQFAKISEKQSKSAIFWWRKILRGFGPRGRTPHQKIIQIPPPPPPPGSNGPISGNTIILVFYGKDLKHYLVQISNLCNSVIILANTQGQIYYRPILKGLHFKESRAHYSTSNVLCVGAFYRAALSESLLCLNYWSK